MKYQINSNNVVYNSLAEYSKECTCLFIMYLPPPPAFLYKFISDDPPAAISIEYQQRTNQSLSQYGGAYYSEPFKQNQ